MSWACGHITELLLIKKNYFRSDYSKASLRYDVQKNSHDFVLGQYVVSATGAEVNIGLDIVYLSDTSSLHVTDITHVVVSEVFCVQWPRLHNNPVTNLQPSW